MNNSDQKIIGNASSDGVRFNLRFEYRLLVIGLLLAVVAIAGNWFYYNHQYKNASTNAGQMLSAVADLKAMELSAWMQERRGDAELARVSLIVQQLVTEPENPDRRAVASRVL